MRSIIIFCLMALFAGCATQRRCAEKYPNTATRDSVYIETIDTVKIILPGDSVRIETKVPCDNFELLTENSRLKQNIKVVNGKLQQMITIKPDTVYKTTTNTVTIVKEVKVPEKVKYLPKFWLFVGICGIVTILLIIAYLANKLRKLL